MLESCTYLLPRRTAPPCGNLRAKPGWLCRACSGMYCLFDVFPFLRAPLTWPFRLKQWHSRRPDSVRLFFRLHWTCSLFHRNRNPRKNANRLTRQVTMSSQSLAWLSSSRSPQIEMMRRAAFVIVFLRKRPPEKRHRLDFSGVYCTVFWQYQIEEEFTALVVLALYSWYDTLC